MLMDNTYVIVRVMQNGQSEVELTTDDLQLAQLWVQERANAVDGIITNYQILTIPFAMPTGAASGSGARYLDPYSLRQAQNPQ